MTASKLFKKRGKIFRVALIIGLVVAVYALVGFLVSPGIVRSKAIEKLSQLTGQRVAIREVKINPFVLSVTIRGFSIPDSSGERCLGFEELYLNFNLSSVVRSAYTFGEFRISDPYVHLMIRKNGRVNLQDLMPPAQHPDSVSSKDNKSLPPLLLQKFVIEHGQTIFEDHNRPTPFIARFDSISFSLKDLTTLPSKEGLYEFAAATDRGETMHWSGDVSIAPLRSKGYIQLAGLKARTLWAYLQDQLKFEVTSGDIRLSCDYAADFSTDSLRYQIANGDFELSDLKIADKGSKEEPLQLGSVKFQDIAIEPSHQFVTIRLIHSERGRFQTTMDSSGNQSLTELLKPKVSVVTDTAKANTSPSAWKISIGHLELKDYSVKLTDAGMNQPANWNIAPIDLALDSIRIGSPAMMAMNLQVGINQSGTFSLKGTIGTDPIQTDLEMTATKISLPDFQPYLNRFARLDLKTGTASSTGRVHFIKQGEKTIFDFTGDVWLDSLRATDRNVNQDFVRWQRLDVKQIVFRSNPPSLKIREIGAQRPYARFVMAADRTTNVQNIMIESNDSSAAQSKEHTSVAIGALSISRGILNFTDLSLTPNFAVSIEDLNGAIKGLSSEQVARADVALAGKVDKYAPAEIAGQINPLSEDAFTDITIKFRGIELTTFAPYAGKYAGYRIDKGKLSLDLHYKLSKRFLEASNHVVMDQLTLGERVDGPDVTKLPVKLAIALLKDRHGVIDLDIPVSGDLNDPKFKVMPLILKILVNVATKAVTAPFALLGSLFSSSEDLSYVSFLPGIDSLDATQQPKLASLAKALAERPALQLDIRGMASDSADGRALAIAAVMKQIRGSEQTLEERSLIPEEQSKAMRLYWDHYHLMPDSLVSLVDSTGKKRDKNEYRSMVAEAAVHKLIADYVASENELRELARRRADAVKGYLILQGGIEDARLMLQDVETKAGAQDGRISVPLSLNAR